MCSLLTQHLRLFALAGLLFALPLGDRAGEDAGEGVAHAVAKSIRKVDQQEAEHAERASAAALPNEIKALLADIQSRKDSPEKKEWCINAQELFSNEAWKYAGEGILVVAGGAAAGTALAGGASTVMHSSWAFVPVMTAGQTTAAVTGTVTGLVPVKDAGRDAVQLGKQTGKPTWAETKAYLKTKGPAVLYGAATAGIVIGAMVLDAHGGAGVFSIAAFKWAAGNGVTAVATHFGASTAAANGLNLAWGAIGFALAAGDTYNYVLDGQELVAFSDELDKACAVYVYGDKVGVYAGIEVNAYDWGMQGDWSHITG